MPTETIETIFSPTTLLWLAVSALAAVVLFASINRRRSRLTEDLREYVDRSQQGREAVRQDGETSKE